MPSLKVKNGVLEIDLHHNESFFNGLSGKGFKNNLQKSTVRMDGQLDTSQNTNFFRGFYFYFKLT